MRALVAGLLLALLGCGTPSRHLTTRVVDDPMVLPRRMLSMGLAGQVIQRRQGTDSGVIADINYGLSDRLELHDLLSLRWAILDDAPVPDDWARRPDRLSLAVRAGAYGIGASSVEGLMVFPVASVETRKRLGTQTRVGLQVAWEGKWVENPYDWSGLYRENLWPSGSRSSTVTVAADVYRQLGDHVALGAGASAHQVQACTLPACAWAARGGELWLGPHVRPRRWLTLALHVFGGGRYRPVGQPALSPDQRVYVLPGAVAWLGTSGAVTFQW